MKLLATSILCLLAAAVCFIAGGTLIEDNRPLLYPSVLMTLAAIVLAIACRLRTTSETTVGIIAFVTAVFGSAFAVLLSFVVYLTITGKMKYL